MLRLLLDEGVSPSLSPRLWADCIDNYPLRDRGLLGLPDHEVWRLANEQDRAVVTINGVDFRRLAKRGEGHAGLMIIPSGGTRNDHLRLVRLGIKHVRPAAAGAPALRNRIVEILPNGRVQIETMS